MPFSYFYTSELTKSSLKLVVAQLARNYLNIFSTCFILLCQKKKSHTVEFLLMSNELCCLFAAQ